jgi:hypothetical protein
MVAVDDEAVESFKAGFAGIALTPGDEGYDEARALWNGWFDKNPPSSRVVARPKTSPRVSGSLARVASLWRSEVGVTAWPA